MYPWRRYVLEIKLMILDSDLSYLMDVKEYLDTLGRFKTDVATLESVTKRKYEEYDIVIANEKISQLVENGNVVAMFPEYSVGKGFGKYSGKKGLLRCIDENYYRINGEKGRPYLVNFFLSGSIDKGTECFLKIQKEIEEQNRRILVVNLSFTLKDIARSSISSSDLVFYLTSDIEEKMAFIKNVLKSEKNYLFLCSINSLREIFEIENGRSKDVISGIRGIDRYEYIFILSEPGVRKSMYAFADEADLNVFMLEKGDELICELMKDTQDDLRIMPFFLNGVPGEKQKDKRVYEPFSYRGGNSFLRRLDSIFGQTDK
jgi:hypothetical protein